MLHKRLLIIVLLLSLLMAILATCHILRPAPEAPWPPLILRTTPEKGEELDLTKPIELTFDQPMDKVSVEEAFTIEPSVEGTLSWVSDKAVRFEPAQAFERGKQYTLRLSEVAQSAKGVALAHPFEARFNAVGFLEVAVTQPEDGASEVASDTTVTVLFNRPVVPLSAIEEQASLPQPLTFVPPVRGKGEWLNTSIYRFTPEGDGFAPSTTYTARIAAALTDLSGAILAKDYEWRFTMVMPAVVASDPAANSIYADVTPKIELAFNQPMDHKSTEEVFTLALISNPTPIPGKFSWRKGGLIPPPPEGEEYAPWQPEEGSGPQEIGVEVMSFVPSEPLEFDTDHKVTLAPGALSAAGEGVATTAEYSFIFTTILYPKVISTSPEDGDTGVDPWMSLQITFSSPMNPESLKLEETLSIKPTFPVTQVYTYWSKSNTQLDISFPTKPSSGYEVTLQTTLEGRYGQKLEESTVIRWHTRAHDPLIMLQAPDRIGVYSAYGTTQLYFTVRNLSRVDFSLYRLSAEDFYRLNGDNWWDYWEGYTPDNANLVRRWSIGTAPPLNENRIYLTSLTEDNEPLMPGLYYLQASANPDAVYEETGRLVKPLSRLMLAVSRNNLTLKHSNSEALIWATNLETGKPVAGLPVRITNGKGEILFTGKTNADGVLEGNFPERVEMYNSLFAFVGDPDAPAENFAVASNQWYSGIERWQFDLSVEDYLQPYTGFFFTDRAIYRPGQKVYFKGIIRLDDDARYSLPGRDDKVYVAIYDPEGKEVYSRTLSLNEFGTVYDTFNLGEEAALGSYYIQATYRGADIPGVDFLVAEYRKPEFEVGVETNKPEYVQGERINVSARATYFFGGAATDADVHWSVLTQDYAFNYTRQGWYDFTDYDFSLARPERYYYGYGELIAEGDGKTDADGRFTFTVPADIAERTTSQIFTIEVSVTDINNQQVSNRTEVIVHKGLFYIGLRPEKYVNQAGKSAEVEVITVDWESEPHPNQELTIVFYEHNWYSVQVQAEDGTFYWESQVEDTPVFTTTVTTDDRGEATVGFVPEKGGVYKVVANGLDRNENEVRSSTYLWVSSEEYVGWRQENNDRIDLVTDQKQYKVGDVATILIPHPYSGTVEALITQERGHIYDYEVKTLYSNSEQIKIPITEEMIPNIFVSVVVMKGAVPETGEPASLKVGYAQLSIDTAEKQLQIALTPNKEGTYEPGETVTYNIHATEADGRPVQAEVALNLVDLAVLTLAEQRGSLLDQFWRERGLGVNTAANLTLSVDRINRLIEVGEKGGDGGRGEEFGVVRRRFPDTAYWNPAVVTDKNGNARVTVELPDNLTTWRLGARAVTKDTFVGESKVDIVSTKDLLVRPVAPRFFVVGDEATLSLVVHNNTDRAVSAEVSFEAEGITIKDTARRNVTIPAGDKVKLNYAVTVGDEPVATLRFGARAGELADAIEIVLPIYRYSTPETVATAGILEEDAIRQEGIALPTRFDPTQGELTIQLDPSLAAGMREGLTFLEHFPYECTEQTVSRFLPNVVTYRAYQRLGLERPDLAEKLPDLVSIGLQRLYAQQHYDGGWGWWVADQSDPYMTAYALLGLIEAQRADFPVEQTVIDPAIDFLKSSLMQPRDLELAWQANRQAFILYVLAEAEAGDLGRTVVLFEHHQKLDYFGRAYLAMALSILEPDDNTRVRTLLADMTSGAIVSATGAHWEEEQVDYYAMNTDTRSTAIILTALARLDPENPLVANVVRWLMSNRQEGHWETTQETAWTIIALTDWMVHTGELEGAYKYQVGLNGELIGEGVVNAQTVDESTRLQVAVRDLLADEVNRLLLQRLPPEGEESGTGRLYYSLYLRTYKPVDEVTALSRGIIVSRQYSLADDEREMAISQARVGDTIRVKLTIIAPQDLHYVVVEDPIPAGTEGVDQSLKTTSVVGQAPELIRTDRKAPWDGYGWWWFSHSELHDEKATLFATYLPKGTYEYTYLIRASLPGEYRVIPTNAYEMYFPEVFGRSDGALFKIAEE